MGHDDEFENLAGALRQQRGGVHMTTPVEQIVRRGRSLRARRRIPAVGALAVMAAATATLTASGLGHGGSTTSAVAPIATAAGHGGSSQQPSPYWSVSLTSDDVIYVTVRQLRDAVGLETRLRSDGLPAVVSFSGQPLSNACRTYPASRALVSKVAHFGMPGSEQATPSSKNGSTGTTLILNPSALPKGAGVAIYDGAPQDGNSGGFALTLNLVYASAACTGN